MRVCGLTINDVDLRVRYIKAVGTVLGLGGGIFFISHLHIKRIQFCSLVYL